MLYHKHSFNLSDEELVMRWSENILWRLFSGMDYYEHRLPCVTQIECFRRAVGEDSLELLLKATNDTAVVEGSSLLHGEEALAYGDAGYQGIDKRADADKTVSWQIAMRLGKRKALNKEDPADALIDKAEKLKAGIRAKVEHPFRVRVGYFSSLLRGK